MVFIFLAYFTLYNGLQFLNGLLLEKMNRNKNKMFKKPSICKNIKRQGVLLLETLLRC